MAAAGVSCRAFTVLRCEMSRVFSVTSMTAAKKYQNETWCRRWRTIWQRGISSSATPFGPTLTPVLAKDSKSSKDSKDLKDLDELKCQKKSSKESISSSMTDDAESSDVSLVYHKGLPRITVPLPSRRERCIFTLKPITHTVGDFMAMLKEEDRGIDRATVTTLDGLRIAASNTIESLIEDDFKLIINDNVYTVKPPQHSSLSMEDMEKLSDVQTLVGQLYESLHVREHNAEIERQVLAQLEDIRLELEPLEQKRMELEATAARRANLSTWAGLVMMSVQFGVLARLTWWEYSWDIMEPVTYFVTYGTAMGCYIYFLLTKQEYMLPDVLDRRHLLVLHKKAKKVGLDVDRYNRLKDEAYELETILKVVRGPLWSQKNLIEQRRRDRRSSSSSRSPSSSPSPSPSPDRNVLGKKTISRSSTQSHPLNTVIHS